MEPPLARQDKKKEKCGEGERVIFQSTQAKIVTDPFDTKNQKEAQQWVAGDLAKAQRENARIRF
jgi:hypothetical protein